MASIERESASAGQRRNAAFARIARTRARANQAAPSQVAVPAWIVMAVVVGDMLAVVAAFAASQVIWPMLEFPWFLFGPSGAALAWPLILAVLGCYTRVGLMARNVGRQLYIAVLTLVALFAVVAAILDETVARTTVIVVAPLVMLMSFTTRRLVTWRLRELRRVGIGVHRVVAVGSGEAVSALVDQLAKVTDHPMVVVGACTEGGTPSEDIPVAARIRPSDHLDRGLGRGNAVEAVVRAAREYKADTVCVVGGSKFSDDRFRALTWALRDEGVQIVRAPGLVDVSSHRIEFDRAGVVTLLHVRNVPSHGPRRLVKEVIDRAGAAMLLLMLALPLVVIGMLVRLTSEGPALYAQTRIGKGGRPFRMYKFRTMVQNAEALRGDLMTSNEHEGGVMFKLQNDPRVTPLGRFLRRSSVDEFPQLLNVLRGDMSLVGPRPPLPDEVAQYDDVAARRLAVKPGMTGLWQVSGRSTLNWDESVRMDLRYVDNWTIGTDMRMLWRTISAVVRGTGAY